jgi:hypothetical protein
LSSFCPESAAKWDWNPLQVPLAAIVQTIIHLVHLLSRVIYPNNAKAVAEPAWLFAVSLEASLRLRNPPHQVSKQPPRHMARRHHNGRPAATAKGSFEDQVCPIIRLLGAAARLGRPVLDRGERPPRTQRSTTHAGRKLKIVLFDNNILK